MPQHLVRLAAHAKDPLPSDNASSRGPFAAPDATAAPEPGDDVERSWLRRLADVLDAPGEIDADACQLTGYLWLGGRRAAEDVFYGNARRVTHMLNVAEPWCAMGPNSDGVRYCGVEARDERSFDVLGEASYGKIRAYAAAERERAPGAVFLLCCDRGVNRCVEINHWFGGSPPNFRTLYLGQIEVDSADVWTNRLLSSSSRSTAAVLVHTLTLKSG